ncbi:MAG: recombination protein RecR [Deltaproteobacteria bacterium]|nr:recombination protein RecR [Deltaproteobacteria bacterium]
MSFLPLPLQDLVDRFQSLPGIGPKSSLRMALAVLDWPRDRALALAGSIQALRDQLCRCSICAALADSDPCPICQDPVRDNGQICVVAEWDSLLTLESSSAFRGRYLVLGGLLSPLDGLEPARLELDKLRRLILNGQAKEIILALGATTEAEITCSFLKNHLHGLAPGLPVTRLAQGIPLGAEVKFMDRETLRQSLQFRQNF